MPSRQSIMGPNPRKSMAQIGAIVTYYLIGLLLYSVFGVISMAQFAYYQIVLCSVALCFAMVDWKPRWARLLAAQAFVLVGFLPRVFVPLAVGLIDLSMRSLLLLLLVPLVFVGLLFLAERLTAARGASTCTALLLTACVAAGLLQFPVLPALLNESLKSHTVGVVPYEEPLIHVRGDGRMILTNLFKAPQTATWSAMNSPLTTAWHGTLPHDPIGVRFLQDEVRLLMHGDLDDKRRTLVCARLTKDGPIEVSTHTTIVNWAPTPFSNPLSPDGALVALNGGQFFAFETGKVKGDQVPNYHVGLEFVEWTDSGTALYYDKAVNTVHLITPGGIATQHGLRTVPESARSITMMPGGKKLFYEEIRMPGTCRFVLQDLESKGLTRMRIARGLGMRADGARAWITETTLAYIDPALGLNTLRIDLDQKSFRHHRQSQLFDAVLGLATAPDSRALFWTTTGNENVTRVHRRIMP